MYWKDMRILNILLRLTKLLFEKMGNNLVYSIKNQPYLCTLLNKKVIKKSNKVILYQSRGDIDGSIVCHLGEVHLKKEPKVKLLIQLN